MILTPFFPFARSWGRIDDIAEFASLMILRNLSSVNPNPGRRYLELLMAGPRTISIHSISVTLRSEERNDVPRESISPFGVPNAFSRFFSAFSAASFFANAA